MTFFNQKKAIDPSIQYYITQLTTCCLDEAACRLNYRASRIKFTITHTQLSLTLFSKGSNYPSFQKMWTTPKCPKYNDAELTRVAVSVLSGRPPGKAGGCSKQEAPSTLPTPSHGPPNSRSLPERTARNTSQKQRTRHEAATTNYSDFPSSYAIATG